MKIFKLFPATEWRTKVAHGETVGFNPKTNKAPDGAKEMFRGLIFCRPCRGLIRFFVLPTVSLWATFLRASGAAATQFTVAAMILFAAFGATAETTNDLSDAEIQGRNLARQLLEQTPATNFTQNGILKIRDGKGKTSEIPIKFETIITMTNWQSIYKASWTNKSEILRVIHVANQPNANFFFTNYPVPLLGDIPILGNLFRSPRKLSDTEIMAPFANSDFWIADLGLEFFHWPEQKILKKETRKTRSCNVLESTNPNPSTNGYSRVVSWIDEESDGIVHAEAYDAQNKLLKVFDPKSFKKVNGQWELQEMEIRNVQTGSRSRIEFDLKK